MEEDVKALISNIPSDTLSYENSEYDIFVGNDNSGNNQPVFTDSSYHALFKKWQDDLKVLDVQKEWIEFLLANNHTLMSTIVDLKHDQLNQYVLFGG